MKYIHYFIIFLVFAVFLIVILQGNNALSVKQINDNSEFYLNKGITVTGIYGQFLAGLEIKYGLYDREGNVLEMAESCFENNFYQIGGIYTVAGFYRAIESASTVRYILDCSMVSTESIVIEPCVGNSTRTCEFNGREGVCIKTGKHTGSIVYPNPCPSGEEAVWNHPDCPDLYTCCIG